MLRAFMIVVILVGATPSAAAAVSVEGELWGATSLELVGEVAIRGGPDATLDLAPHDRAPTALTLQFGRAEGRHVVYHYSGVQPVNREQDEIERSAIAFPAGSLRIAACSAACEFLLYPMDDASSISLSGDADGPIEWTQADQWFCGSLCADDEPHFMRTVPVGAMRTTTSASRSALSNAKVEAHGTIGLLIANGIVDVVTVDGATTRLNTVARQQLPALGIGPSEEEIPYVFLRLTNAGTLQDGPVDGTFYTPLASASTSGDLRAAHATGVIRVGHERREFTDETVSVTGDLVLEGIASHGIDAASARVGPSRADAGLSGQATRVQIGGEVLRSAVSASDETLRTATWSAILLAAAVLAMRFGPVILYSRIARSRVLENSNRQRVLDAIELTSGRTTAELARELGIARIVVRHHVGILIAHGLAVERKEGRARLLYSPGNAPAGADRLLAAILRDPTRRAIAEEIASAAGLTQAEIAERIGRSQRLVSHHVSRLMAAGLVACAGESPKRYRPIGQLADAQADAPDRAERGASV